MEIYLNVKTVDTIDMVTLESHVAYTVSMPNGKSLKIASAWTLKDAVELFAKIYRLDRSQLKLRRPFRPQRNIYSVQNLY